MATFAPDFQPMLRPAFASAPAVLLGLAVALSPPATGHSQARPVGAPPSSPQAVGDRLGECPVEDLRAAWSGMDALEAVAVEQEVLRLCTRRAELTAGFLKAHKELRAALGDLLPPSPAAAAATSGAGESAPAGVETAVAADVTGPNEPPPDLVAGEANGERVPTGPDAVAVAGSEVQAAPSGVQEAGSADEADGLLDRFASSLGFEAEGDAPPPSTGPEIVELGRRLLRDAPAEETASAAVVQPEPAEPSWQVLFTARGGDGAWLAALQEVNPPPLLLAPLPAADGEDVAALPPVLAPRPPLSVLLAVGDRLSDGGPVIVRIDGHAVEIAPEPDGTAESVPWAPGDAISEPGRPDFLFELEGEER